jgi:hypothetical protein
MITKIRNEAGVEKINKTARIQQNTQNDSKNFNIPE